MVKRYEPDGKPRWNGKVPEDFNEEDIREFMAETDRLLKKNKQKKEELTEMTEENNTTGRNGQEATPTAAENALPLPIIEVSARLIEPVGNLLGFATVKFNGVFAVNNIKILTGEKGMFVGMPSRPDKSSPAGYRDIAMPITADFRKQLNEAVIAAYYEAEKQQELAAASRREKTSIPEQLKKGAEQAGKDNAARPAKAKGSKAQNNER